MCGPPVWKGIGTVHALAGNRVGPGACRYISSSRYIACNTTLNICLYACMIGRQASMLPPSKAVLQYVGDARDRLARRWQAQLDGTHEHTQQEANKRHTGVLATNALGNKRLGRFFVLMHTHLIPNDNGIHG